MHDVPAKMAADESQSVDSAPPSCASLGCRWTSTEETTESLAVDLLSMGYAVHFSPIPEGFLLGVNNGISHVIIESADPHLRTMLLSLKKSVAR